MDGPQQRLGAACPPNSAFYICPNQPSGFLGCCGIDPCGSGDGTCPWERLASATFNASAYDLIPAQGCMDAGSQWYTCAYTTPPFMGCCVENACAKGGGCAQELVRAARLSGRPEAARAFTLGWRGAATVEKSGEASAAGKTNTTREGEAAEGQMGSGVVAGIVAGSVIGGVAVFALLMLWWRGRAKRMGRGQGSETATESSFVQSVPRGCARGCGCYRDSMRRQEPLKPVDAPYLRSKAAFGHEGQDAWLSRALPPRPIDAVELEDATTRHR
ncbi:hypothetical protein CDD82_6795 [Ophiocordyceps australis]|uniref:Uncharacterized protein n=1 Tax=Ophiocordyceps australis TaxID=1399860 RepID=A0A2C5ZQT2_9HYPO|nr:hypothetical protein CDD82_6795 [Ophiocordyceps australis]